MSEASGLYVDGLRVAATDINVEIVSDVSFTVRPSATLGIVGESGCGKTTVAMALLGFARPGTSITAGRVVVAGRDLLSLSGPDLRRARGRVISYVPQNPARALSPGRTVGGQLEEMIDSGGLATDRAALRKSAWEGAQLPFDSGLLARYPHQLSGGQQQRVAIAMALVCEPQVIVMDEPTTGLDVLTQDRLIDVIVGLRERRTVSIVYVSHDLGVVRNVVDEVVVMSGAELWRRARSTTSSAIHVIRTLGVSLKRSPVCAPIHAGCAGFRAVRSNHGTDLLVVRLRLDATSASRSVISRCPHWRLRANQPTDAWRAGGLRSQSRLLVRPRRRPRQWESPSRLGPRYSR